MVEHLLWALLANVELDRRTGLFDRAYLRLDEITRRSIRSGMGLHEADCHLEYARLYVAISGKHNEPKNEAKSPEKALEHLTTAKEMIKRMGYHRRDKDVEEIEAQLAQAS